MDATFVRRDGAEWYRLAPAEQLAPFLMSLVSDSDHWMFVSSTGGLTAGRVDENGALFPYETVDRLHRAAGLTGPLTLVRVGGALWEPFAVHQQPQTTRALSKSLLGNALEFEEQHTGLGLTCAYRWANSERFGFVRHCALTNTNDRPLTVEVLDGLLNVLPSGVELAVQQQFSCLLDAYKQTELDEATGLALYTLAAVLVDRAEPAESLTANVVWQRGLTPSAVLLSERQVAAFRAGQPVATETRVTGQRGAYLVAAAVTLAPGETKEWWCAADVQRTQAQVVALRAVLSEGTPDLLADIAIGSANLRRNVASADGLQAVASPTIEAHHFANTLFNNMRGGVMADNGGIDPADFEAFVRQRNRRPTAADRRRLAYEYLPLTFSRRHGDPSRPWNRFAIRVKHADGSRRLDYQGNWRDIFQNWEALCHSFPDFLEPIIAKFVNASTVDGFNPYRVTRDGLDWEVPEPDSPWANLGYWGDHQVVYLTRLLEASLAAHPGALEDLLTEPLFTYADVPYRLAPYAELLAHPKATIAFDEERQRLTEARCADLGADGKLLHGPDGLVRVNLAEKLLVPILSKLSNFVPDGGIWMNTQRPEWNDANNALVGYGLSMVTLCQLRRHLALCARLFATLEQVALSAEVAEWLERILEVLRVYAGLLRFRRIDAGARKRLLDELGTAFDDYRAVVYAEGLSAPVEVAGSQLEALCLCALPYLDHAIRANRREDGLYHAYNLLSLSPDGERADVEHLYPMLEGQVAVLGAGVLTGTEAVELVEALYRSDLYREDQDSFLLYPDRRLPGFLEKNIAPAEAVAALPWRHDRALACDAAGDWRFAADLQNAGQLAALLDALDAPAEARQPLLDLYEQVFHHHAFTGRSGSMYAYEGLGSIYWHMVAKLLLALAEAHQRARREGEPALTVAALAAAYQRVRSGLGFNKSALVYGAFPTDPYSHTPKHAGAQQPGMTGQVKEELLARWAELGVVVEGGAVRFEPVLLSPDEFLAEPRAWDYLDLDGEPCTLDLPAGSLAFTLCGVPVVYRRGTGPARLTVVWDEGPSETFPGNVLYAPLCRPLFGRTGQLARLEVDLES